MIKSTVGVKIQTFLA